MRREKDFAYPPREVKRSGDGKHIRQQERKKESLLLPIQEPAEFFLGLARDFGARRVGGRKFVAPVERPAGVDHGDRMGHVAGGAALTAAAPDRPANPTSR